MEFNARVKLVRSPRQWHKLDLLSITPLSIIGRNKVKNKDSSQSRKLIQKLEDLQ